MTWVLWAALAAGIALCETTKSDGPGAGVSATNVTNEIPLSVFVVPHTPAEGRDPFFPRVSAAVPAPVPVKEPAQAVLDTSALVLNGITGPPRRSAMINGRTFEKGEEAEVRGVGGVRFLVKCEEIKDETVVIIINGELRRELRLRSGI